MFNEALVVDVVTDLSYYTQEKLRILVPQIETDDRVHFCDEPAVQDEDKEKSPSKDFKYYVRAPRNTILAIDLQESAGSSFNDKAMTCDRPEDEANPQEDSKISGLIDAEESLESLRVYYPFFSSHLCLPVKPGESVWTFTDENTGVRYWVTRVSQPLPAEDPNFTHRERRCEPVRQPPVNVLVPDGGKQKVKTTFEEGHDLDGDGEVDFISKFPSFQLHAHYEKRDTNRVLILKDGQFQKNEKFFEDIVDPKKTNTLFSNLTFSLISDAGNENIIESRSVYDYIYQKNTQRELVSYEPVPRMNKRPGDLVLQGSNNSSITLGTERGWTTSARPEGSQSNVRPLSGSYLEEGDEIVPLENNRGVVDIVAGRGRISRDLALTTDDTADFEGIDPTGTTQPRLIRNTRGILETNKNPGLDTNIVSPDPAKEESGHVIHPDEGDPDFLHDASRVYVSMKSNPDELLFGAPEADVDPLETATTPYPDIPEVDDDSNASHIVQQVFDSSSIIVKSDEVRIVARHKAENVPLEGSPPINGSIKIHKEGVLDSREGEGSATIMMQPDGTVMINGPKIVIGSGAHAEADGHGGGQQLVLGVGATEPLVLGNELKTKLEELIDAIKAITVPTPAGPSGTPNNAVQFDTIKGDLSCILSMLGKTL